MSAMYHASQALKSATAARYHAAQGNDQAAAYHNSNAWESAIWAVECGEAAAWAAAVELAYKGLDPAGYDGKGL